MRRKPLLFLSALLLLAVGCTSQKENIIVGNVEGLRPGDVVYLATENPAGSRWEFVPVDSVTVTKAGEFTFRTPVADNAFVVALSPEGKVPFSMQNATFDQFLEGYGKLTLTGNVEHWRYLRASGGIYEHPAVKEIYDRLQDVFAVQREGIALSTEARAEGDQEKLDKAIEIIQRSNKMQEFKFEMEEAFIDANPDAAYSAYKLRRKYYDDFDGFVERFEKLTPRVRNTTQGLQIADFIDKRKSVNVAGVAPDFTAPTLAGDQITLHGMRGQYILLDFWGSWCGGCRAYSEHVVDLYGKLQTAGVPIEFIGIAVRDRDDEVWKKAIEDDGYTWIQINDAHLPAESEIHKQYAVYEFPTMVLVNPEGVIEFRGEPKDLVPMMKERYQL